MKKSILFLASSFLTLLIISCSKNDIQSDTKQRVYSYLVKAISNGTPEAGARVIAAIDDTREIIGECDINGNALIESPSPVKIICGVSLGKSGTINIGHEGNFIIEMTDLKIPRINNVRSIGTFGVYSTDSNGDVSFKYTGTFQGYYCTSYLPNLGLQNPNSWDGWNLTNWLPTWKGKKLLVPRRYQIYHQTAYGYSISSALFLMSLY